MSTSVAPWQHFRVLGLRWTPAREQVSQVFRFQLFYPTSVLSWPSLFKRVLIVESAVDALDLPNVEGSVDARRIACPYPIAWNHHCPRCRARSPLS